jgi:hypothetical protein
LHAGTLSTEPKRSAKRREPWYYQLLARGISVRQNEFLIVGTLLGLLPTEIGFRRGRAVRSKIVD